MKSKKFGFLKHYRKIKVEGVNHSNIINKCIRSDIDLRNLRWKNHLESTMELQGDDFSKFRKLAGHSYKISVLKEGGVLPVLKSVRANIITVAGAFLLGALIFYQSLFVAEIRIDGYSSIDEASLRQTIAAAGLYEGVRKSDDYNDIKTALYKEYDKITWVSIYEEGRLIKINIAESGQIEEEKKVNPKPVNIIASRSGMIERIIPLKGNAMVQKGDYINKGDILISGVYEYQSSDYSKGDDFFYLYSHAEGQVLAKVPKQITYYFEKNKRAKELTGKWIPGIYFKIGDMEADTADVLCKYEVSIRNEKKVIDIVKPLPIAISLVKINEAELNETPQSMNKIESVTDAALRQYAKENLEIDEKILKKTVDYSESQGLIKADILLEVLEDIGVEKEIKKKPKKSKETTLQ